jgi:hypothetical protein
METNVLLCDCDSAVHHIIYTKEKEDKIIYCQIHLNKFGFFKRVAVATRYVLGLGSGFGAYDDLILSEKHKDKLLDIYNFLNNNP